MAFVLSAHGGTALMTKKGTKCMTTFGNRLVAAPCTGEFDQIVSPNFAVGGLQIGSQCLRRSNWDLTLAECRSGDPAEVFALNVSTLEISNASGQRTCIDLNGNAGDWQMNQKISLYPCHGGINQKWLPATVKPQPGHGKLRNNDTLGEVQPGDSVKITSGPFAGQYLVVK